MIEKKLIAKITDQDILGIPPKEMKDYTKRLGARGIVIRDDGKIALFNKSNKNEYKLPGGGIENDEDPELAFKREALEETGCEIEIIEELGITEENKNQNNFKQISYVYVAKVINDTHSFNFTQKEIDEGAKLLWVEKEKALELITNCYDNLKASIYENVYQTQFVVLRDRKILEYYLEKINGN